MWRSTLTSARTKPTLTSARTKPTLTSAWTRSAAAARLVLGAAVFVASASVADAAILLVRPDGSGDYPDIQQALDAAQAGDMIVLASGTFTGPGNRNLDFRGKAVVLRGLTDDPRSSIIDCQHVARAFWFHSGETYASVVRGLTVTGGDPSGLGGAMYISSSSPRIENCVFLGNTGAYGGAIYT